MISFLRVRRSASAVLLWLAAAACISSNPPPAVRYFDPSTTIDGEPPPPAVACELRVTAASHLGREFVVRTAPHEVVFDSVHSWVAEPRLLVQAALERLLGPSVRSPDAKVLAIDVEVFELDLLGNPRAHLRLMVRSAAGSRAIDVAVPAADREPASFASAMAAALGQAAAAVYAQQGGRAAAGER